MRIRNTHQWFLKLDKAHIFKSWILFKNVEKKIGGVHFIFLSCDDFYFYQVVNYDSYATLSVVFKFDLPHTLNKVLFCWLFYVQHSST